jgi:hypothetical protein
VPGLLEATERRKEMIATTELVNYSKVYVCNPKNCPVCGSENINGSADVMIDGNKAKMETVCNNCFSKWTEIFQLFGIEKLEIAEYKRDEKNFKGVISEEKFIQRFRPIMNNFKKNQGSEFENSVFDAFGPDQRYILNMNITSPAFIWSIVEAQDGKNICVPGYYIAKSVGYVATRFPHSAGDQIEVNLS